jgi:hypothetical protein
MPLESKLVFAANGIYTIFINGSLIAIDSSIVTPVPVKTYDLMGKIRIGKNVLSIEVHTKQRDHYGIKPLIMFTTGTKSSHPKPPGFQKPMSLEEVRIDKYVFPEISNFEIK